MCLFSYLCIKFSLACLISDHKYQVLCASARSKPTLKLFCSGLNLVPFILLLIMRDKIFLGIISSSLPITSPNFAFRMLSENFSNCSVSISCDLFYTSCCSSSSQSSCVSSEKYCCYLFLILISVIMCPSLSFISVTLHISFFSAR